MKNNYGLPIEKLDEIFERDKVCVYCHKQMIQHRPNSKRGDWYTIEHLNYLPPWNNPETVVICCWSCNSSRGDKKLTDWFKTKYCADRNISLKTVTRHVRKYINTVERSELRAINVVLRAEREMGNGKFLRGDLRTLMKKYS